MADFTYLECPYCQYSIVMKADGRAIFCYHCASDNGRDVAMKSRPAQQDDEPEGYDARQETDDGNQR
jgi:hypothetical protein